MLLQIAGRNTAGLVSGRDVAVKPRRSGNCMELQQAPKEKPWAAGSLLCADQEGVRSSGEARSLGGSCMIMSVGIHLAGPREGDGDLRVGRGGMTTSSIR